MARIPKVNVYSSDEISTLLDSEIAGERCEGIGHLISGDVSIDAFVEAVEALESSTVPVMFGMTEGEIASVALDVLGVKRYEGTSPYVRHYIAQLVA